MKTDIRCWDKLFEITIFIPISAHLDKSFWLGAYLFQSLFIHLMQDLTPKIDDFAHF